MPKIEIEIPQAEYDIIGEIARKLGVSIKTIVQQEIDASIQTVSCWIQRAEMILNDMILKDDMILREAKGQPRSDYLNCPDCNSTLEIKKNQLACTNGHCDIIAVRASGKIIRASVM